MADEFDIYVMKRKLDKAEKELADVQSNICEWIEYDYRTMCPKEHGDVDSPYWRIPYDKVHLTYCPYCGKKIFIKQ